MRIPFGIIFCPLVVLLGLAVAPADAACPRAGPRPVPGTLAAANAGCDATKPASTVPPGDARPRGEPGVIRSGNTEIRMRGYLQTDVGTGGVVSGR